VRLLCVFAVNQTRLALKENRFYITVVPVKSTMAHRKKSVNCPQIMQMEALECGAASLAMVLAYHGKWLPLEQLRLDCGVSRDGSNAVNILKAARSYGLKAAGFRLEVDALKAVPLPCIIHWNFNHFVVFRGFKGKNALINDPGRGPLQIPPDEFGKSFTGVTLTFEPEPGFTKEGRPRSILHFARTRMKGMALPFAFIVLTGFITSLIGVINPVFSRIFMDRIISGLNPPWLYPLAGAMFLAAAVQFVVMFLQSLYLLKSEGKFAITSNTLFLWHVLRLPMEFFSQRMAGDIAARQASNQQITSTLLNTLAPLILNFAMLAVYLLFMFRYSALLALVGAGAQLLNIAAARVASRKRIEITRVQSRDQGKLTSATVSGIGMIETLKAAGAENGYFERWAGYQAAVNSAQTRVNLTSRFFDRLPVLLQELSKLTVLGLGVFFIQQRNFTVGMLLAFQGFLASFMRPANTLVEAGQVIQEMRTGMERIEDVINYTPDVPAASVLRGKEYRKLSGRVSMKGITFGYSRLAPPLLENFNLELEPGASVAFVGHSGCGKSTLAKLISGLYKPWSGELRFDGELIQDIPREVITGSVAVVDQDISIFEDTVSANLKMWDKSIEDFEMILAAKDACIHGDIMVRENGYNYRVMEGGKDFSGGQRQRLEIARLLAQDPSIVILDEATSSLDAKTEQDVMEAVKQRDITRIIVAHRLSTIRDCGEIIVLDHGKVVERGTHESLLAKNGAYAALIRTE
jgi:NHLM bacteriocin system ABC transporter peptidase/ATP-binding protein